MPISLTPIQNGSIWAGYTWAISNEKLLAEILARVALGQHRYARHIIEQTGHSISSPIGSAAAGAKKLLTVEQGADPYHRDGWLFQVISWIAVNIREDGALIRSPHMISAHKGFDGLHVKIDQLTGSVEFAVISEDKATENPRKFIRERVWKEFESMEGGGRDNELVAEVSALLAQNPEIDVDQAVESILWDQARAYRVSITVGETHRDEKGRKRLFRGYKNKVTGSLKRRTAETLYLKSMRDWMAHMAQMAILVIEDMEEENV